MTALPRSFGNLASPVPLSYLDDNFDVLQAGTIYASQYNTLADAATAAGGKRLLVNTALTVSADTTIGATVELHIIQGGSLSIATGKTLTIAGALTAGDYQIFSWTGTGTVVFSTVDNIRVRWFGAKGDDSTDDTTAIQKTIDVGKASGGRHSNVVLGGGVFRVSSTLNLTGSNQGIAIVGTPWASLQQGSVNPASVIKWTGGASPIISSTNTFDQYIGFSLQNFGSATYGILSTDGSREFFFMVSFSIPSGASAFSTASVGFSAFGYVNFDRCEFESGPAVRIRGIGTTMRFTRCLFDCIGASPVFDVDSDIDIFDAYGNTFNIQTSARTVFDNTASTTNNIDYLSFIRNEFDGNGLTSQMYMLKLKNVFVGEFVGNQVDQFGAGSGSTDSLIQLTNCPRFNVHDNYGNSISSELVKTNDTASFVYPGPNYLNPSNTLGALNGQSGNFIPVTVGTPSAGVARIHGEKTSALASPVFLITVTNNSNFDVQFANPPDSDPGYMTKGQVFTVMVSNTSGGAMGTVTFDGTQFKTTGAFTSPADTKNRSITFVYNGTNCTELSRVTADVSN